MTITRKKIESSYKYSDGIWSGEQNTFDDLDISLGILLFRELFKRRKEILQIDVRTNTQQSCGVIRDLAINCAIKLQDTKGLKHGDIITLCIPHDKCTIVPLLAAIFLGITVNLVHKKFERHDLIHIIGIVKPNLILCDNITVQQFNEIKRVLNLDVIIEIYDEKFEETFCSSLSDANENTFQPVNVTPDKTNLLLLCSSGVTGLMKVIPHTHKSIYYAICSLEHSVTKTDIILNFAPFLKAASVWVRLYCVLFGSTHIGCDWSNSRDALKLIQKYKVTYLNLTQRNLMDICRNPNFDRYPRARMLRLVWSRGSPNTPKQMKFFRSKLERAHIINGYACTEWSGLITHFDPIFEYDINVMKINSVGRLCPGSNQAKIVNIKTREPVGPNEEGELLVKSEVLMTGYFPKRDNSETFTKDGWFKTGDCAKFDTEHCLFIVGRISDLLWYESNRVTPHEVEYLVHQISGVKECCVMGIPDPFMGDLPIAFVVKYTHSDVSDTDIIKSVALNGEDHQRLRGGVQFIPQLPYTASGKIRRLELKKYIDQMPPKCSCKC